MFRWIEPFDNDFFPAQRHPLSSLLFDPPGGEAEFFCHHKALLRHHDFFQHGHTERVPFLAHGHGSIYHAIEWDALYDDFLAHLRRTDLFYALVDNFRDPHLPSLDPAAPDVEDFFDDGDHTSLIGRRRRLTHGCCFLEKLGQEGIEDPEEPQEQKDTKNQGKESDR